MIFISFFTEGNYEKVMNTYLLPSLKKFDLKYDIVKIKNLGSWQKNTGYKSKFIKEMLEKHKEDVCFIDADGTIESYPELLFKIPDKYNIAIHWLLWEKFWHNVDNNSHKELLSGTIVVKYKDSTFKLLDEWIKQVEIQKNKIEQKILEEIVLNNSDYKVYDLPVEYCTIIKRDGTYPDYIKNPMVLHYQASRLYKNRREK